MDIDAIRSLFGYNHWVNHRLFDLAEQLPPEQTRERFGASFDTIHGTLTHMVGAEVIWFSRWCGVPPRPVRAEDFADVATIRARWVEQQRETEAFLAELTPERLFTPLQWTARDGKTYELPLWQPMLQVVNHGTHHRSELADMLTRAGHPPPPTDLIVYYQELSQRR